MQELMKVKQLPIIEEQFKKLSEEVDKKVKEAEALVCTEETVKEIKQVRADLNKEVREMETQRKAIKNQVLEPYMQFEEVYKRYVADKYRNADLILGGRIKVVEDELKKQKEQEIKDYFEELKEANNIDFITYEQAKINVTLSASKKSLKEQSESFINKISEDLKLIDTQEHKAEILVEYKQNLNVSNAITTVMNRFKAVEEEEKRQKELKEAIFQQASDEADRAKIEGTKMPENHNIVDNALQTLKTEEKIYTITFTVTGTAPKLKQLKDYLLREGYQYE